MRVNQHTEHTKRFIMFDEADAAHVRCEVVNFAHVAGHSSLAGSAILQIKCQVLYVFKTLIPLFERLDIDRAERARAEMAQLGNEMSTDKSPCATDDNVIMVIVHEFKISRPLKKAWRLLENSSARLIGKMYSNSLRKRKCYILAPCQRSQPQDRMPARLYHSLGHLAGQLGQRPNHRDARCARRRQLR